MNFLVFVETGAGELEKILSGVKSIVVKENTSELPEEHIMEPGDSLYFLRDNDERVVRVKATVLQVLPFAEGPDGEDISHILKELQPKLQLTEDQYNCWSPKKEAFFVEFEAAQKIEELQIPAEKITQRTRWIAFEEIHEITQEEVKNESRNDSTG